MVFINEWMPNPVGSDTAGEWVELFNSGPSLVSLSGWFLKNGTDKKVFLNKYTIGSGSYLVLKRSETKLTLRNTDETLFLYDSSGTLVDQSGFFGSAPEGKSFARIQTINPLVKNQNFIFSQPTPGQQNSIINDQNFLMNNIYPFGQPLNTSLGYVTVFMITICSAFLLAFFITILVKRNDYLSKLFFSRD